MPVLGLQALREIWARTVHRTTSPVYVGWGLQGLQNLGQLQPRAPEISKPQAAVSSVPPSLGSKEVHEPLPALGTGPAAENPTISHAKPRAKSRIAVPEPRMQQPTAGLQPSRPPSPARACGSRRPRPPGCERRAPRPGNPRPRPAGESAGTGLASSASGSHWLGRPPVTPSRHLSWVPGAAVCKLGWGRWILPAPVRVLIPHPALRT